MYITDFICTYKRMDSDTDKEYLYKIQMLQAFGLEQWDDRIIEQTINDLQLQIKDEEQFKLILNAAKKSPKLGMMISLMFQDNPENDISTINRFDSIIFIMLFNYDLFDLMHKCICEHLNNGFIKRETYEEIMEHLLF